MIKRVAGRGGVRGVVWGVHTHVPIGLTTSARLISGLNVRQVVAGDRGVLRLTLGSEAQRLKLVFGVHPYPCGVNIVFYGFRVGLNIAR
jgi:hypothetical protein